MSLILGEHWPAWHPTARRGVLETAHGDRPVLLLLAPFQPSGVTDARERAAAALELRHDGVLPLLSIQAVNSRIAWVYDAVDGLAASHIAAGLELGPRAAAELVLEVAKVVVVHPHPGPEPEDVLLTLTGVRVANFARPFALAPAFRAPNATHASEDAARVYRLGALFAAVLAAPLPTSSDPAAHDAAVRRALIRAMSRPGAVFSERYGAWLRALLAWDPADRPPLSRVIPGLQELVTATAGPTLGEVLTRRLQQWITDSYGEDPEETTLPQDWESLQEMIEPLVTVEAGRRTLGDETILGDLSDEDDPTVDSELGIVPKEHTPPSVIERGSIPVGIGPPPEVAARRPRLPSGFLEDVTVAFDDPTVPASRPPVPVGARPGLQIAAGGLILLLVGLGIAWALFS